MIYLSRTISAAFLHNRRRKIRCAIASALAIATAGFTIPGQAQTHAPAGHHHSIAPQQGASEDQQAIVHLLKGTFDRPGAPLAVAPIVVEGDHAIAGWAQDQLGGRALMRKVKGQWTIHLCSGDPLKHAEMLIETGIPPESAKKLAASLAAAERELPAHVVALFSKFEGTVHIGPDGHHPPVHHGGHGAHPAHHK